MERKNKTQVLVVDDDKLIRELLDMALAAHDYDVIAASDGASAKQHIQSGTIDVVLLDLMMPVMDGFRFLHWLRHDQQSRVPVIVLSAMAKPGIEDELKKLGATDVAFKPINIPELLNRVAWLYASNGCKLGNFG